MNIAIEQPVNYRFLKHFKISTVTAMREYMNDQASFTDDMLAVIHAHKIYCDYDYRMYITEETPEAIMKHNNQPGEARFHLVIPNGEMFDLQCGMLRANNPSILVRNVSPQAKAYILEFIKMVKNPKYSPKRITFVQ